MIDIIKLPEAKDILVQLTRIADAQEGMQAIATEARAERLKLSDQMKAHFKAGFAQGGPL